MQGWPGKLTKSREEKKAEIGGRQEVLILARRLPRPGCSARLDCGGPGELPRSERHLQTPNAFTYRLTTIEEQVLPSFLCNISNKLIDESTNSPP